MDVIGEIRTEYETAMLKFGTFASAHEGYAILLEEVDELWEAIKSKDGFESGAVAREAVQVAAMAVRFLVDVCNYDL